MVSCGGCQHTLDQQRSLLLACYVYLLRWDPAGKVQVPQEGEEMSRFGFMARSMHGTQSLKGKHSSTSAGDSSVGGSVAVRWGVVALCLCL